MRAAFIVTLLAMVLVPAVGRSGDTSAKEVGTLTEVQGDVQVGQEGQWRAARAGERVAEGQSLRTGAASAASVVFGEGVAAAVAADTEIAVSDLLLRARLERMRSRVSAPADTRKVEMQVTPTTGVRGTEQTEEKAEELKREHYWNEGEKKSE